MTGALETWRPTGHNKEKPMSKMVRATFALICAAFLAMGCGGDPGSSGNGSGDTDPSSGSGTTTPHFVTLPVTLVAGDATDTVTNSTAVRVWKNTENQPMGAMPISYDAYVSDPIAVDANDPDLVLVGIDVFTDGYLVAIAPTPLVDVDQLKSADDTFPISAIAACDLTGAVWSCTQTITQNGATIDTQTKTSTLTMVFDSERGTWGASIDALSVGFTILGDTISAANNATPTHGEVAPDGNGLQFDIDGVNADANYTCSR